MQSNRGFFGLIEVITPSSWADLASKVTCVDPRIQTMEWRLDGLCRESLMQLDRLRQQLDSVNQRIILTLRPQSEYGSFIGSESERCDLIEQFAALQPDAIDIEHTVDVNWLESMVARYPAIQWIRSYHDWHKTPEDLASLYQRLQVKGVAFTKIVTTAAQAMDALRILKFLTKQCGVLAHTMGEHASFSRVLNLAFGSEGTYCQAGHHALGQMSPKEMLDIYHAHDISIQTACYALLGEDVSTSLGHIFHNQAFQKAKVDAVYVKIPVPSSVFDTVLSELYQLKIQGLSITMPFKQQVTRQSYVIVSDTLKLLGIVNTLAWDVSGYLASNTDQRAVNACLAPKGQQVGILGMGSMGQIVAYEAFRMKAETIQFWNRRPRSLPSVLQSHLSVLHTIECVDIWISTLPQDALVSWLHKSYTRLKPGSRFWNINYHQPDTIIRDMLNQRAIHYQDGQTLFELQAQMQQAIWAKSHRICMGH